MKKKKRNYETNMLFSSFKLMFKIMKNVNFNNFLIQILNLK